MLALAALVPAACRREAGAPAASAPLRFPDRMPPPGGQATGPPLPAALRRGEAPAAPAGGDDRAGGAPSAEAAASPEPPPPLDGAVDRLCPPPEPGRPPAAAEAQLGELRKACDRERDPRGVRCARYAAAYARLDFVGRIGREAARPIKMGDRIVEREGESWSADDEVAALAAAGNACALAAALAARPRLPAEAADDAEGRAEAIWEGALGLVLRQWTTLGRETRAAFVADLVDRDLQRANGAEPPPAVAKRGLKGRGAGAGPGAGPAATGGEVAGDVTAAFDRLVRARLASAERCADRLALLKPLDALLGDWIPEARRTACAAGATRACSGPVPAWLRGPFAEPAAAAPTAGAARRGVRAASAPAAPGLECRAP